MKFLLCFLLISFSSTSIASFWDVVFPAKPYPSEKIIISDLKVVLKYVSQCQYVSCNYDHGVIKGLPSDNPVRSCSKFVDSRGEFKKRFKLTDENLKTKHVQWYLDKIAEKNSLICD